VNKLFKKIFLLTILPFNISAMHDHESYSILPSEQDVKIDIDVDEKETLELSKKDKKKTLTKIDLIDQFIKKKLNSHLIPELSQIVVDYDYTHGLDKTYYLSQTLNFTSEIIPLNNNSFIQYDTYMDDYRIWKLRKKTGKYEKVNREWYNDCDATIRLSYSILCCLLCCFPYSKDYNLIKLNNGLFAYLKTNGTIRIGAIHNETYTNLQTLNKNLCYYLNNPFNALVNCGSCIPKLRKRISKKGTDTATNLTQLQDGTLVHSIKEDHTIKVWRLRDDKYYLHQTLPTGHTEEIFSLLELPNQMLISVSFDKKIKIWNLVDDQYCLYQTIEHTDLIRKLISLKTEAKDVFFAYADDSTIRILKSKNGQFNCVQILNDHTNFVLNLTQLPDGSLVSCSWQDIKIWNLKDGKYSCSQTLKHRTSGITDWVNGIIQLQDNSLASYSSDSTIKIWKIVDGQYVLDQTFDGRRIGIHKLIQLKNGELVSSSLDDISKIWTNEVSKIIIPEE